MLSVWNSIANTQRQFICPVFTIAAVLGSIVRGDFPEPFQCQSTTPFPSVQIRHCIYDRPRPLRAWIVLADLRDPNITLDITPRDRSAPDFETLATTTLEFARMAKAEIAVNASPFTPVRPLPGLGVQIVGLAASNGDVYSMPEKDYDAFVVDLDGRPEIVDSKSIPSALEKVRDAASGFKIVVRNGVNQFRGKNAVGSQAAQHPRTAVGLSANRESLFWIIVDGRQPGISEGLTLFELGELAIHAGCADALNLDGGGSTTLVTRDATTRDWRVVNTPVGLKNVPKSLRPNGNSMGMQIFGFDGDLTAEQLRKVMPTIDMKRTKRFLAPLNRAMREAEIDSPRRMAAFLAQIAHESGELRHMEEIASGEAYEGRKDLGNTEPGDGRKFKGRGPIQLTGRINYRQSGEALGFDLERRPELVSRPDIGCRVAAWFWKSRQLNALADSRDFREITRRINGGVNGMESRERHYRRALEAFGVQ